MTDEDEEFNRIEREASLRKAAVHATVTKKEWQGLTDEEIERILWALPYEPGKEEIRAIEALLKEKNT